MRVRSGVMVAAMVAPLALPALAEGFDGLRPGYYLPVGNSCERRGAIAFTFDGKNLSDEGQLCLSDPQSMPKLFRQTCAERSTRVQSTKDIVKSRRAVKDVIIEVRAPAGFVYDGDAYERCGDL